jgi:hypothetical protein
MEMVMLMIFEKYANKKQVAYSYFSNGYDIPIKICVS